MSLSRKPKFKRHRLSLKDAEHLRALRALVRRTLADRPNAVGLSVVKRDGRLEVYVEERER